MSVQDTNTCYDGIVTYNDAPGSHSAIKLGCICDPEINRFGAGLEPIQIPGHRLRKNPLWAVNSECPVHFDQDRKEDKNDNARIIRFFRSR